MWRGGETMAEALQVARFFVDLAEQQFRTHTGDRISALSLQKLLYFAQGWHIARYGEPLFDEDIEAWQYGPVVPSVYRQYKRFDDNPIHDIPPEKDAFTEREYGLLLDVARDYWRYSSSELVRMTHAPGTPWQCVYQPGERHTVIPRERIRAYFQGEPHPMKTQSDIIAAFKERVPVYSAKAVNPGVATLPREVLDGWDY